MANNSAGETNKVALKKETAARINQWKENQLATAETEFEQKKQWIQRRTEQMEVELKLCNSIAQINSSLVDGKPDRDKLMKVEKYISKITPENMNASNMLSKYCNVFDHDFTVKLICELIMYFVSSSAAYKKLNDTDMIRLALHIATHHPYCHLFELISVLREGVAGKYGQNFHTVDIETFQRWMNMHNEQMSAYFEAEASKAKTEPTNPAPIVDERLKRLNEYKKEMVARKRIRDNINQKEK